jgi:Asp-tRNA(Asn)/Glu-tRNA(Gln) amidotransferase A subunit family amidase
MSDQSIWRTHGTPLLPPLAEGPLTGRTVAVKDLFAVGGFPVGAGNPTWLAQAKPEPADAWAVHALRQAGAAIAGIAQTDELAFSLSGANGHYGTPPNTRAPALVTGGSSSGPAAAVAAGQADIGLGTDTAGSIRVPASVCGLYGMRPTHGAVPDAGALHLAPSFDTVGWLAADPVLLRETGTVLLPPPPHPIRAPRRLLCRDLRNGGVRILAATLDLELGREPVPDTASVLAAFRLIQAAEAWELRGAWIMDNPGALAPDVEARFRAGAGVSAGDRRYAATVLSEHRGRFLDTLGDDAWLVLPAAGGPGHRRDAPAAEKDAWRQATLHRTVVASAFGLPSCVIPCSVIPWRRADAPAAGNPPEGLALIGPPGADHALLTQLAKVRGAVQAGGHDSDQ